MPLPIGAKLGPYEVLSTIGAGGMGEVYRARDTKLNRDVAVKVLLAAVANDAERIARFSREAQVLASLNHANIAHIYGLEDADSVRAIRERNSRLSPDERWIAYASDESKSEQIYVQSFPGKAGKWQVSTAGGTHPQWSADGRELFYIAPDHMLMAVPVRSSLADKFEFDAAAPLFETRVAGAGTTYSVSPDGRRFLMQTPAPEAAALPVTILTNWLARSRNN